MAALTGVLCGQTDQAKLAGLVADASGAVIPNARLRLINERTGSERILTSNEQGQYAAPNLPPSQYKLIGSAEGLGPNEYTNIALAAGQ